MSTNSFRLDFDDFSDLTMNLTMKYDSEEDLMSYLKQFDIDKDQFKHGIMKLQQIPYTYEGIKPEWNLVTNFSVYAVFKAWDFHQHDFDRYLKNHNNVENVCKWLLLHKNSKNTTLEDENEKKLYDEVNRFQVQKFVKCFAGTYWKADLISSTITKTFGEILETMENLKQCNSELRMISRNHQIQIPWYPNFDKVCAHLYVFCLQKEMKRQIDSMERTIKREKKKRQKWLDETLLEFQEEGSEKNDADDAEDERSD